MRIKEAHQIMKEIILDEELEEYFYDIKFNVDYEDEPDCRFVSHRVNEFNGFFKRYIGGGYGNSLSFDYSPYEGGTIGVEIYFDKTSLPEKPLTEIFNNFRFLADQYDYELDIATDVDPVHPCVNLRKTNADRDLGKAYIGILSALIAAIY